MSFSVSANSSSRLADFLVGMARSFGVATKPQRPCRANGSRTGRAAMSSGASGADPCNLVAIAGEAAGQQTFTRSSFWGAMAVVRLAWTLTVDSAGVKFVSEEQDSTLSAGGRTAPGRSPDTSGLPTIDFFRRFGFGRQR